MKVAAVQRASTPDVSANQQAAVRVLAQAARHGAEQMALPEYFCATGRKDTDKLALREPFGDGLVLPLLSVQVKVLTVWLVGGTLPLSAVSVDDVPVRNAPLVLDPSGPCLARHDKMHRFQFQFRFEPGQEACGEIRVLQPGSETVNFSRPARAGHTCRIGLNICDAPNLFKLSRILKANRLADRRHRLPALGHRRVLPMAPALRQPRSR